MIFRVWIPGRFSLTNKMLSNLRAAEKFHGKRPRDWVDLYNQEVQAIRMAAKMAANQQLPSEFWDEVAPSGHVCAVSFGVFGHRRHDPDAWYLLGKPVVDGFADAGVLRQDRADVWDVGGRVCQSREEERYWYTEHGGCVGAGVVPTDPGVMAWLSFFERPVPRE
jgi:hypothetical protein